MKALRLEHVNVTVQDPAARGTLTVPVGVVDRPYDQMRGLLRQVLANKAQRLDSEAERLALLLGEITTAETRMVQSLTELETEQQRLDRRADELDTELRQNQNWIGQAKLGQRPGELPVRLAVQADPEQPSPL